MDRPLALTALALVLLALPATALADGDDPGRRHDASESRGRPEGARDSDRDGRHGGRHDGRDHDRGAGEPRDASGHQVAHPGSGPHRPPHVAPPPPPRRHRHVHHVYRYPPPPPPPVIVHTGPAPAPRPAPVFDRSGDVSVGLNVGGLVSGYQSGPAWGDGGMGLEARYRVTDGFGLALGVASYGSSDGARLTTPVEANAQFFAFPHGPVNPYLELGVATVARDWEDPLCGYDCGLYTANDTSLGGHAGIGLEIALGRHAALDLEMGWLRIPAAAGREDPALSAAFQTGMGFQWYF